jgi:hypothetical protein
MKSIPATNHCQWTAADAAELDVLTYELVDAYYQHRERCDHCLSWQARLPKSTPCPYVQAAIAIVIEWRTKRQLLTSAEQLRLERDAQLGMAS